MLCCACGSSATSRADVVLRARLTRDVPRGCCAARADHARRPARMLCCSRGSRATSSADVVLRARITCGVPRGCCAARADQVRRPARMLCCARGSRVTSSADVVLRARLTRDVPRGCNAARPADAPSASPAQVAGPKGRVARRGEALVLSDAETGSFGGAWNAKRNGARRRPRADVVLRARRRPRTTNSPSSKRNRSARYGCQRARGLRPSCHPRSARRRAWDGMCCVRLTCGVERGLGRVVCGCAHGSRATSSADVVLRVRLTRDVPRRCCAARAAHA